MKKSYGIPADFPVRPLGPNDPAKDRVTCGTCGRSWDDAIGTEWTPAPSARCPFEYFHDEPEDEPKTRAKAKRTPGLLYYKAGAAPHYQGQVTSEETGQTIAVTYGDEDATNARHLFACWNACEGINPEAVPDMRAELESNLALLIELRDKHLLHTAAVVRARVQKRIEATRAAIAKAGS